MRSLDEFAQGKLDRLTEKGLRRRLEVTVSGVEGRIERDGALVSFASNDYLGLTQHADVKAAAQAAVARYGAGAGSARLVTGEHPLLGALEEGLAELLDTEAVCLFGSGFLANTGTIPALVGPDDLILIDALSHASLHVGARLSRAEVIPFAHNDPDDVLRYLADLRSQHARCLVVTEGVFGMDGDRAPLQALDALTREHDAWLMVDDAHAVGVLGEGRGTEPAGVLRAGTLSKAFAAYGGFVGASAVVVDLLRHRARTFVYTTGLPPAVIGAALAALDWIRTHPEEAGRPVRLAQSFASAVGLPVPDAAIVPWVLGSPEDALRVSARLRAQGFLVPAIRPPTVPEGTARLRFSFSATHRDEDVANLVQVVLDIRAQFGIAA